MCRSRGKLGEQRRYWEGLNCAETHKMEWMGHNRPCGGIRNIQVRLMGEGVHDSTPDLGIFNTDDACTFIY